MNDKQRIIVLKEIALKYLKLYEDNKDMVINEYSTNFSEEYKALAEEVERVTKQIKEL